MRTIRIDNPPLRHTAYEHSTVVVRLRGEEGSRTVCGDPWCTGNCGYPALVSPDRQQRLCGPEVAIGPVLQPWRVKVWTGETEVLTPKQYEELKEQLWT